MSVYLSKSSLSDETLARNQGVGKALALIPTAQRMNDVGSLHQFHFHPASPFEWGGRFRGLGLEMNLEFEVSLTPAHAAFEEVKRVFRAVGERVVTQGEISARAGVKELSSGTSAYEGGPLIEYASRRSGQPPWLKFTYSRGDKMSELQLNPLVAAQFFNDLAKRAEAPVFFWIENDRLMTKPLVDGTDVTQEALNHQRGFYCRLPAGRSDFEHLVDVAEYAVRQRAGKLTYVRMWLDVNLTNIPGTYVPPASPEAMAQNLLSWISEAQIQAKSIDLRMVARVVSAEGFATIRALCGPKDQTFVYVANLKEPVGKSKDRVILGVITDMSGHRLAIGSSKPLSAKELAEFGKRFGVEFYAKTARVKKVPFEYSMEEKHYFPPE